MSKFFLCEIENIEKSSVEIKVTGTRFEKDDDDCIRTVRTVCFDFSKHDKVFEDKIAEQKGKISMLKSLANHYRDAESKLFDENQELKQRIAELERKETEKQRKCAGVIVAKEIKGQIYVTLDDFMSFVNDL